MNCLNRFEIQEYIDKEIAPGIRDEIAKHFETCKNCMILYKQAIEDKELIKKLLIESDSIYIETSLPQFKFSEVTRKKRIYFRLIPVMVAASIIAFILLFRPGKVPVSENIPEAEILLYRYYEGQDLNKMWYQKSQIIILQDEKGNMIEPIFIY